MDAELYDFFRDALAKATASASGAALDSALAEVGWSDALVEEPQLAISLLFGLQGSANATSSALETVLASGLGVAADGAAVVLPWLGEYGVPGSISGGALHVRGLGLASLRDAATVLVPTLDADGTLVSATVDAADLTRREINGLDRALGLVEVSGAGVPIDSVAQVTGTWPAAVAGAQVALAYELIGGCRQMLALAREHALSRIQFGKPIASFQAVRHRLAESLVATEAAAAAADAYWLDANAAPIAKAMAGQAGRTVARHAQQVLAGMGFTAEHEFHHHLRRTRVLDQLFGSAALLTRELGERILATGELPAALSL